MDAGYWFAGVWVFTFAALVAVVEFELWGPSWLAAWAPLAAVVAAAAVTFVVLFTAGLVDRALWRRRYSRRRG